MGLISTIYRKMWLKQPVYLQRTHLLRLKTQSLLYHRHLKQPLHHQARVETRLLAQEAQVEALIKTKQLPTPPQQCHHPITSQTPLTLHHPMTPRTRAPPTLSLTTVNLTQQNLLTRTLGINPLKQAKVMVKPAKTISLIAARKT